MITRVVVLWFLLSALVAYLGRRKSVGFWGFFFFSLIFSPVVGALSLLVAGPSAAERRRQIEARALVLLAAGHRPATPAAAPVRRATEASAAASSATIRSARSPRELLGILPRAALRSFAIGWLVTIIVFSAAYWSLHGRTADAIPSATALSLEVATFGFSPGASLGAYVNAARLPALYPPPGGGTPPAPALPEPPQVVDSVNVTEAVTRQSEHIAAVRKEIEALPLAYSRASTALIDRVAALFSPPPMLRLLMGIQRAVVVILLVLLIARLAESRYESLAREMLATAEQHRSGMNALEESLREISTLSKRSLETMRSLEAERIARDQADQAARAQKDKDSLVMEHATT
jgi:hypothetical protein